MYPISPTFQRILETRIGRNRYVSWWGTITLTTGTTYNFNADHISQGTGSLNSSCDIPGVGGAYSTEFQAQFFLSIDPRRLKNAVINLNVRLTCATAADTWDEAESFFWSEIASTKWDDEPREIYTDIPMGLFLVTDAKRAISSIKVTAYDFMQKFDRNLPRMDATARTPFNWLRRICTTCGVELGMTEAEIKALPNGNRSFTYADVDSNVKTCRDLISNIAAVVGSIAVIDRFGKLVLARFGSASVGTLTPDDRFSSTFSDFQNKYTGLSAHYKAKGVQEYYKNVGTLDDSGLIIEVGTNIFLQISNDSNRATALQNIVNAFKNVLFTPYEVSIPFNPSYDLLDVLTFTGGHAPTNCYGPITSINRKMGGAMTVQCATPDEQENPVRETVEGEGISTAGLESDMTYASSGFWLVTDTAPENAVAITSDTVVNEAKITCTVDNTCTQIAWTGAYTLDEDATVTVKVKVDDDIIYVVSDDQRAGNHVLNVTTGHDIKTLGEHTVKIIVSMTALSSGGSSSSGSNSGSNSGSSGGSSGGSSSGNTGGNSSGSGSGSNNSGNSGGGDGEGNDVSDPVDPEVPEIPEFEIG